MVIVTCGFVRLIVTEVSIPHLHATVPCVLACESRVCGMRHMPRASCADLGVIKEGAWPLARQLRQRF